MNGETRTLLLTLLAVTAWVAFAEHPTAANFRTAIVDSLSL